MSAGGLAPAAPPAAAASEHSAAAALRQLFGCSRRQAAQGVLLLVAFAGVADALHATTWLGLFGLFLAPGAALALVQLASERADPFRRGWPWLWALLLPLLALVGVLAVALYRRWMTAHELHGLSDAQAYACVYAFSAVTVALPLWHAQHQARALHLASLRQGALAADLKALQAQIEPHFLFNTLANTRYLARHAPDKAVQMLDHLIAYLHSALPDLRSPMSTLGREFELAEHYLALMAIRFGERLQYRLALPSELSALPLPPLLLMSLVENAVRHGVEPQPGSVCVCLTALATADGVRIVVSDDGAGLDATVLGSGVGLRNLRERLAALYGDAARFALRRGPGGGVEAELCLPLVGAVSA